MTCEQTNTPAVDADHPRYWVLIQHESLQFQYTNPVGMPEDEVARVFRPAWSLLTGQPAERESTTDARSGIGMSHAETSAVEAPSVAFPRWDARISPDAVEDGPAHLLSTDRVLAEVGEEHLHVSSALSRALMCDDARETLLAAENAETVRNPVREVAN